MAPCHVLTPTGNRLITVLGTFFSEKIFFLEGMKMAKCLKMIRSNEYRM